MKIKKLTLNKMTLKHLNDAEMRTVKGGTNFESPGDIGGPPAALISLFGCGDRTAKGYTCVNTCNGGPSCTYGTSDCRTYTVRGHTSACGG